MVFICFCSATYPNHLNQCLAHSSHLTDTCWALNGCDWSTHSVLKRLWEGQGRHSQGNIGLTSRNVDMIKLDKVGAGPSVSREQKIPKLKLAESGWTAVHSTWLSNEWGVGQTELVEVHGGQTWKALKTMLRSLKLGQKSLNDVKHAGAFFKKRQIYLRRRLFWLKCSKWTEEDRNWGDQLGGFTEIQATYKRQWPILK